MLRIDALAGDARAGHRPGPGRGLMLEKVTASRGGSREGGHMEPDGKQRVASAGAALVQDGMWVGLGSGTTVLALVDALGRLRPQARYVASSPSVQARARLHGLTILDFDAPDAPVVLSLALDGADAIADDGWVLKGRGGAHTRERVVARAAGGAVLLVTADKRVPRLGAPVPVEVLRFGLASTLRALEQLGEVAVRPAPLTPDGGVLVDVALDLDDPARAAAILDSMPGVVDHGLFPPSLVSGVMVAEGSQVTTHWRKAP